MLSVVAPHYKNGAIGQFHPEPQLLSQKPEDKHIHISLNARIFQ